MAAGRASGNELSHAPCCSGALPRSHCSGAGPYPSSSSLVSVGTLQCWRAIPRLAVTDTANPMPSSGWAGYGRCLWELRHVTLRGVLQEMSIPAWSAGALCSDAQEVWNVCEAAAAVLNSQLRNLSTGSRSGEQAGPSATCSMRPATSRADKPRHVSCEERRAEATACRCLCWRRDHIKSSATGHVEGAGDSADHGGRCSRSKQLLHFSS
jgi:hypothetical protein